MEHTVAVPKTRSVSTHTADDQVLSPRVATVVLLIEGFVSVSIQMIVLRQLVPVVGYSINVTSIVITTFLAALAFGYRSGGRLRSSYVPRIRFNLIVAALVAAIGLSFVWVDAFFAQYFSLFGGTLVAVALYSLLVVAPLVYLLAQTVVLLINFRQATAAAEQAGETFHLSTIGNVFGGLITTLVVMYYFGIAAAVVLDTGLLVVAYLMLQVRAGSIHVVIASGVLLTALVLNVIAERGTFLTTTAHANYAIEESAEGDVKFLLVNGQNASRTDSHGNGHAYIEWFEDQLFSGANQPKRILALGAGGFTLGQGQLSDSEITFVDVDTQLAGIADRFLAPHKRGGRFVAEDARAFLLRNDLRYDAIVLDTYSHRSAMPIHLTTIEFFSLLRDRLEPDGVVYMNFIAGDDDSIRFSRGIDNTVRAVFASCSTQSIYTDGVSLHNSLYRCQRSGLDEYRAVYSDKNNRAALDMVH